MELLLVTYIAVTAIMAFVVARRGQPWDDGLEALIPLIAMAWPIYALTWAIGCVGRTLAKGTDHG